MIQWYSPLYEPYTGRYVNGTTGKIGKWEIFTIVYDACVNNEHYKYKLTCVLPGIKNYLGYFAKQEEGQKKAEDILKYWLKYANLNSLS